MKPSEARIAVESIRTSAADAVASIQTMCAHFREPVDQFGFHFDHEYTSDSVVCRGSCPACGARIEVRVKNSKRPVKSMVQSVLSNNLVLPLGEVESVRELDKMLDRLVKFAQKKGKEY